MGKLCKKIIPILVLDYLFVLTSCSGGTSLTNATSSEASSYENTTVSTSISETSTQEEKKDYTTFQLLNDFSNVKRGMKINLEEYIKVIPGKNEEQSLTEFKSYVLNSDESDSCGYIDGGNGITNTLIVTNPGEIVLNIEANGKNETFVIEVEESEDFYNFEQALLNVKSNYAFEKVWFNSNTNALTTYGKGYRNTNYIYDEVNKDGYLLSSKDDNVYSFNLDSINSSLEDIQVIVPPTTTKMTFNSLFVDMNTFASSSKWSYSELFQNNLYYKKFKYLFSGTSNEITRFFADLYYLNSSYTEGSTTYSPYAVMASYQNGILSFLPLVVNSSGTSLSYLPEVQLSSINEVAIDSLDTYVEKYLAPKKENVTPLTDAIKEIYNDGYFDYTVNTTTKVVDSSGNTVKASDPVVSQYFSSLLYNRYRYITRKTFYSSNFGGIYPSVKPGGLTNSNSKTYEYLDEDNDGNFEKYFEYKESGKDSPEHWWSFEHIRIYVHTVAYSTSYLNNGYPTYDEETNTYTYFGNLSAGYNLIVGGIKFGYSLNALNVDYFEDLLNTSYTVSKFNVTYDTEGKVSNFTNTIEVTYKAGLLPNLSEDYTWVCTISIEDIGSTSAKCEELLSKITADTSLA